jgi:hypothetical protein
MQHTLPALLSAKYVEFPDIFTLLCDEPAIAPPATAPLLRTKATSPKLEKLPSSTFKAPAT